jgi:hypothetical protein
VLYPWANEKKKMKKSRWIKSIFTGVGVIIISAPIPVYILRLLNSIKINQVTWGNSISGDIGKWISTYINIIVINLS